MLRAYQIPPKHINSSPKSSIVLLERPNINVRLINRLKKRLRRCNPRNTVFCWKITQKVAVLGKWGRNGETRRLGKTGRTDIYESGSMAVRSGRVMKKINLGKDLRGMMRKQGMMTWMTWTFQKMRPHGEKEND
jgi:hypothetical protein